MNGLAEKIRRAAAMPPGVLTARVADKAARAARGAWRRARDRAVPTLVIPEEALALRPLVRAAPPRHVVEPLRGALVEALERAEAGVFDLLGSGPVPWRAEGWPRVNAANARAAGVVRGVWEERGGVLLDWHADPVRGHRWDAAAWWPDVRYGPVDGSGGPFPDIKMPWELGRAQHLPMLSLLGVDAALRERVGAVFRSHVVGFAGSAPPGFGAPWACAMDVAIRGASWALAWSILSACGWVPDEGCGRVLSGSLRAHAAFVAANLEWDPWVRGNHYLADVAGLGVMAAALPRSAVTRAWLELAGRALASETVRQFGADGGNFEASTSYHRLSGEMALFGLVAVDRALREAGLPGAPGATEAFERLGRAATFTASITAPDGSAPQIGDNDAGRFVVLTPEAAARERDHRGLIDAVRGLAGGSIGAEGWLGGAMAGRAIAEVGQVSADAEDFDVFGLWVLRTEGARVFVRAGHLGQDGHGGHAHNDQLSFVLELGGVRVIDDPGTGCYTSDPGVRGWFRSTAAHNTVSVAGREQADTSLGLFAMRERDRPRVEGPSRGPAGCVWSAEHRGMGVTHRRELTLRPGLLEGVDRVDRAAGARAAWFHIPADASVESGADGSVVVRRAGVGAAIRCEGGGVVRVEPSRDSPTYGVVRDAVRVAAVFDAGSDALRWTVRWHEASREVR